MALDLVTVTGNPGSPQWRGQGEGGWTDGKPKLHGGKGRPEYQVPKPSGAEMGQETGP